MDFPVNRLSLNLTRQCNLRCSYPCFTYGCRDGTMTFDIAKKAVNWAISNGLQVPERHVDISFWGGEPLLEWDLLKNIVLYTEEKSKDANIRCSFGGTTNGTLLTVDKFDFLDEHKIFFMVSLDGTPDTHNYHRKFVDGSGSHDVVVKNFKAALKRWPFYKARLSPSADRVSWFYEDIKFIFELGCNSIMFSPAYESNFTDEHWRIFEEQCYKVVDYIAEQRRFGRILHIEHFSSYRSGDASRWPCGAGRNFMHINHLGYIYTCHRAEKFNDTRPYLEQEWCIGHVDTGIIKHDVRDKFINFRPTCYGTECFNDSPCHGGCYSINFDLTGDITTPYSGVCKYTDVQKRVSKYYKEKIPNDNPNGCNGCVCNFTVYNGPDVREMVLWTKEEKELLKYIIEDIDRRLRLLEEKVK